MCFIITMVSLIFSYNFFMAGSLLGGVGALFVALFFIYLMVKNIFYVKNLKSKKRDKVDN